MIWAVLLVPRSVVVGFNMLREILLLIGSCSLVLSQVSHVKFSEGYIWQQWCTGSKNIVCQMTQGINNFNIRSNV